MNSNLGLPFWLSAFINEHGTQSLLLLIPIFSVVAGGVKALKSGGILSSRTDCAKGPIRAPSLCLRSFRR
jgi:hypothetical protein